MLSIVIIFALHGFTRAAFLEGVLRMDDNYQYFNYQDIIKAFGQSKPPWYYGHNVGQNDVEGEIETKMFKVEKTCTYFAKENLNNTNVNFTKYHKEEDEKKQEKVEKEEKEEQEQKMKPTPLYGTFFTTPLIETNTPKERKTPNGITVSSSLGGPPQVGYKLLYSNYEDCHIIRPFPVENVEKLQAPLPSGARAADVPGLSYYPPEATTHKSIKPKCVVLLGDTAARKRRLPRLCQAVYKSFCGTEPELKVVFDNQCPHIPNALGC